MKRLRSLFEESADVVAPAPPRSPGWWVVPASYITASLLVISSYVIFGWAGLVGFGALLGALQIGYRMGTGKWLNWDQ